MTRYLSLIIAVLFIASCQMPLVLNDEQKSADAVYLSLNENFVLSANGEQEYINSSRMLLNTHASFNRMYADSHIKYDPMFQKFEVLKAETENSMGKSVVKENAINDILPKGAQKSAYYNRLRTKVVSHMGTEIGAIINFDYKIFSNSQYKPGLFENIVIGKEIPIKEYSLSVIVPEGKKLNYKLLNSDIEPIVEITDKGERYTWKFSDVSALKHERGEPEFKKSVVRLVFTTLSKSDVEKYIKQSVDQKSGKLIKESTNKLVESIESPEKKLAVIHSEVMRNIAACKINFKQASYRCRNTDKIWNDAEASRIEKSLLLKEMLNAVGYRAKILFDVPENLIEFAQTNPNVWGNSYVYVDSIYNGVLLKANGINNYSAHLELNESKLYNPIKADVFTLLKEKNSIRGNINININSRKTVWGDAEVSCSGICKPIIKSADEKYIKNQLQYALNYKDKGAKYVYYLQGKSNKINDKFFTINLPSFGTGFSSYNLPILLEKRETPLELKGTIDEQYVYTLGYSDKFSMVNKLKAIKKENNIGKLVFNIKKVEDKWLIEKSLVIKKSVILPDEYGMFKELVDIWNDKNIKTLYFTITN